MAILLDSLRGSSVAIGTMQRRLAWPLRQDDTHKSQIEKWKQCLAMWRAKSSRGKTMSASRRFIGLSTASKVAALGAENNHVVQAQLTTQNTTTTCFPRFFQRKGCKWWATSIAMSPCQSQLQKLFSLGVVIICWVVINMSQAICLELQLLFMFRCDTW